MLGFLDGLRKGKTLRKEKTEDRVKVDQGVSIKKLRGSYPFITFINTVDEYPIQPQVSRVKIVKGPNLGEGLHYVVDEDPLNEQEYDTFSKIMRILSKELEPPEKSDISHEDYILKRARGVAFRYRRSLGQFNDQGWEKIFYYIVRELAGYGSLHTMFLDPNIEDISCNGLNSPLYVWHSKYEGIPTNIAFTDEQTANDFIVKLAHKGTQHISTARPLLDAMLPEKHRLAATFMKEVSTRGSTFCIRKFRAQPFSIVELIQRRTLNEQMAAYFWLLLEHKMSLMIIGGTGAGKTSLLNASLSLLSPNDKIVTVEETPEINPPLENWTQLHSRQSFQFGSATTTSIDLFDLMKMSLRYRPDYIIVGEIRGEEAYVLFQALATGHGGLCTIHADSLENVVKRLTSEPMNVSEVYIPLMNSAIYINRVELPKPVRGITFGRRIQNIWEIEDFGVYRELSTWKPNDDTFDTRFEDSYHLKQIAFNASIAFEEVLKELDERATFLRDMVDSGVRGQIAVAEKILSYYSKKRVKKGDINSLSITQQRP